MLLSPSVHLVARLKSLDSPWEFALRYVAATAATLLAIAAAQLVTPNSFVIALAALTLIGAPVSVWLRLNDLRVGGFSIPRPLLNSLTVLISFGAGAYFVLLPMGDFFGPLLSGDTSSMFWVRFGGGEPIEALMRLFLLFAAFRSFALISDKDATLTTVPSFSVLLLMIPIHQGIEVVMYFVLWTFVAATLFALDHRSEVRQNVRATVPAIVAGQDVRLGARSLATILGISLLAAGGISFFLTSRNAADRSSAESAVSALATRITNLALAMPESSFNSGPERQIDFKSGPNLPSRAPLWQVQASNYQREPIFPSYWRMFTLSNYNGVAWTASDARSRRIERTTLDQTRWPVGRARRPGRGSFFRWSDTYQFPGYDIGKAAPDIGQQFGKKRFLVRQQVTSLVPNIGFVPVQPAARVILMRESEVKEIRARADGAIDVGILQIGQRVSLISDVPPLPEYGFLGRRLPTRRLSAAQIAESGVKLSASERAKNLKLPATLPVRVRSTGKQMLGRLAADASNYAKAQRLALLIQDGATYTLRPPTIPDGRDATDFFLFEGNRRGYCTYFAGALTVLCRTQGIPARVVSGFANVAWIGPDAGMMREGNAHAWTEIWVEGFGWTLVDATPPGDRGDNSPTWLENWSDWTTSNLTDGLTWLENHQIIAIALPTALLMFGAAGQIRKRRWKPWPWQTERDDDLERHQIGQIYRRTSRQMTRRFRPKQAWETPDEWLQSCAAELSTADTEALRRITSLYLSARYASQPLPNGSARLAKNTAAGISWKRLKS